MPLVNVTLVAACILAGVTNAAQDGNPQPPASVRHPEDGCDDTATAFTLNGAQEQNEATRVRKQKEAVSNIKDRIRLHHSRVEYVQSRIQPQGGRLPNVVSLPLPKVVSFQRLAAAIDDGEEAPCVYIATTEPTETTEYAKRRSSLEREDPNYVMGAFLELWGAAIPVFNQQRNELDHAVENILRNYPPLGIERTKSMNRAKLRLAEAELTLGGLTARYNSVREKMMGCLTQQRGTLDPTLRGMLEAWRKYYDGCLTQHRLELDESGNDLSEAIEEHYKQLTVPNVVFVPSIRVPLDFRQISTGFRESHEVSLMYTAFEMETAQTPMDRVSPRREYTVTVTKKPFGFKVNMAKMIVKSLTKAGPAEETGVVIGSRILRIDDRPVHPYSWTEKYKRAKVPFKITFAVPRAVKKPTQKPQTPKQDAVPVSPQQEPTEVERMREFLKQADLYEDFLKFQNSPK